MKTKILLGFEVGTGAPVEIPLHHTIVTGTTQLSGKTTTLEGLITRSGRRAIAFRTKRGESGFESISCHAHPPYFRERADWQYVQSLLEATMRERLKFERSWIIRASKGARTLDDVYRNVCDELDRAKGLAESVYTTLRAYLEIVLPELKLIRFATKLQLQEGLNVIDLIGLREEVQALVIASVLESIHKESKNTLCVVPEAWKFMPQGRNTPVRLVIESLAREGAAIGNFVFLDSQDITGVDKGVLKNFDVWILGRQREINEVERALKQIPLPSRSKPKAEEVATLQLGNFLACYGEQVRRVYVQPAWLAEEAAQKIAMTGRVDAADIYKPEPKTESRPTMEDQKVEALQRRVEQLERENNKLKKTPVPEKYVEVVPNEKIVHAGPINIDAVEREASITFSKETREFVTTNPEGRIMFALVNEMAEHIGSESDISVALKEHGWNYTHGTMAPELSRLVKKGDLVKVDGRPCRYRVPGKLKIKIANA